MKVIVKVTQTDQTVSCATIDVDDDAPYDFVMARAQDVVVDCDMSSALLSRVTEVVAVLPNGKTLT